MFKKLNPDRFLPLFTGMILSLVAAWYAIAGLIAIFAAAFWPILIMGSTLELGKILTASYLYRNWNNLPVLMKTYFTGAVVILMMITSMGVFGFLSKAHIEQNASIGDYQSKIEIIDSRIDSQKERIKSAQNKLKQIDTAINKYLERDVVTRALNIRRQQEAERKSIDKEIKEAQAEIERLQLERVPIAKEIREVEKEVGPIRYVAELIYGKSDKEILEKAVRLVIIALVLVLDPLALLLIISANRKIKPLPKNFKPNDKYEKDAKRWFKSNTTLVQTDGEEWKDVPGVTISKSKWSNTLSDIPNTARRTQK